MKIKKAITLGFKKFKDGIWRKPVIHNTKRQGIVHAWQAYILKKCKKCKEEFLASHQTNNFCSHACQPKGFDYGWRKGNKFPNERNGVGNKRKSTNGYIEVYLPGHILADIKGRVLEHRLIIYNEINRPLTFNDVVHHINGNRSDNRRENLILTNRSDHNSHHKSKEVKFRKRDINGRLLSKQDQS